MPAAQKFFFAGRICGERTAPTEDPWPYNCKDATGYSGGIRQRVCVFSAL